MSKKATHKPYIYRRAEELGIPITDGRDHVKIVVTDDDVVNAKKANSKHCALARAALRIPGVNAAYFFRTVAFLEYGEEIKRHKLPVSVQKEIVSFDRAGIFAAGVYQLAPMSPSLSPGATKRWRKARAKSDAKAREVLAAKKPVTRKPKPGLADAKWFAEAMSDIVNRNVGDRTVSGIQSDRAPIPLPASSPTRRYVHRTQYVRDLKEPK